MSNSYKFDKLTHPVAHLRQKINCIYKNFETNCEGTNQPDTNTSYFSHSDQLILMHFN